MPDALTGQREAVSLRVAARAFGKSEATLRRWIREGAPCDELGAVGRGHGSRVIVADLAAWKRSQAAADPGSGDALPVVVQALCDTFYRDGGAGVPMHIALRVPPRAAAALLVTAYQRIARALIGADCDGPLPAQIERLWTISVGSAHGRSPNTPD